MRHVSRPSAAVFAPVSAASSAASAAVKSSLVSLPQPHRHLRTSISPSREDNESAHQIPIIYTNKIQVYNFSDSMIEFMSIPLSISLSAANLRALKRPDRPLTNRAGDRFDSVDAPTSFLLGNQSLNF